jgi:phenylpyruvate tautomerase PptA (4-oxalocrotonate tautomerase family)
MAARSREFATHRFRTQSESREAAKMPLIDVIYPSDALSSEAQKELSQTLWSKALRWEGIDDNERAASVAWVYLDGRPRHSISVGGHDLSQNVYRINVRVMAGFMDQERIDGMARDLTQAILAADGTAGNGSEPRVFCIIEEIPSGTWSIDGATWTTVRIEAMERAIKNHPRIEARLK